MEYYWDVLRRLADELEADFRGKSVYVGDELRKMAKYLSKDKDASQQSVNLTLRHVPAWRNKLIKASRRLRKPLGF